MKNYKKASELGLETIELEDQVLLVDKNLKEDSRCFNGNHTKYKVANPSSNHSASSETYSLEFAKKENWLNIIASTKQLEKIPLLVIEDEVKKMADDDPEGYFDTDYQEIFVEGFIEGYNKAKEIYKFTKEDLRNGLDMIMQGSIIEDEYFPLFTKDEIIKSLSKKELWVEVELGGYFHENNTSFGEFIPKITNNQIKVIWK